MWSSSRERGEKSFCFRFNHKMAKAIIIKTIKIMIIMIINIDVINIQIPFEMHMHACMNFQHKTCITFKLLLICWIETNNTMLCMARMATSLLCSISFTNLYAQMFSSCLSIKSLPTNNQLSYKGINCEFRTENHNSNSLKA